jgi:hypothetical protein
MSYNWKPVVCFGLAWPLVGLGFSAIYFGYMPAGLQLIAEAIGLSVAGGISGALLLTISSGMKTPVGRGLVLVGYALFSPLALMGGLLAPAPFESGTGSPLGLALLAPLAIIFYASAAIGIGLGFTGGLAVAAHSLALRIHRPSPVRAR